MLLRGASRVPHQVLHPAQHLPGGRAAAAAAPGAVAGRRRRAFPAHLHQPEGDAEAASWPLSVPFQGLDAKISRHEEKNPIDGRGWVSLLCASCVDLKVPAVKKKAALDLMRRRRYHHHFGGLQS